MLELTDHQTNGCNEDLNVIRLGAVGPGGAYHVYAVSHSDGTGGFVQHAIRFQNGPIPQVGTNGLTHEALLAILLDRLRCFQAGPYACAENAIALLHLSRALEALKLRTLRRVARGVEGTHQV